MQVDVDTTKPYSFSGMQKIVHEMRDKIGLPSTFTLDACRHGGMTELEEAELTDGQGRALSAHKSQQSYEGYAKRDHGAGAGSNPEAPRAPAGERGANKYSEWRAECSSEWQLWRTKSSIISY